MSTHMARQLERMLAAGEHTRRSGGLGDCHLDGPGTWRVHLDPLPCAFVHKRFLGVSLNRVETRNMRG